MLLLLTAAHATDRVATVRLGVGIPDLLGGSVSLTALRPFELEVGGGTAVIHHTAFARAGAAIPFLDRELGGRRFIVEGLALGGYRYLVEPGLYGSMLYEYDVGYMPDFSRHGVELGLAGEVSWWLGEHFALDIQSLVGGGLWVAENADGSWPFYMNYRLSFGVGF